MKTIKEHLNDLREPERTAALKAIYDGDEDLAADSHADALYFGCTWNNDEGEILENAWDQLAAETYFDAPQLTSKICKDKMVEHMATGEDYEKLEDVVKGIKATDYIREAPATEPNFGTIFPKDDDERQKYPLAQTDLLSSD